jgi:DNA-binding response OmpR family regulator
MTEQQGISEQSSILIVDDSPANLHLLSRILAKKGLKARVANSGPRALEAARANPPDLILLDIMMPGMDGYEVCEQLKADEQGQDIPVLFISALGSIEDKVKAFQVGGVDYITKPFQADEVLARVTTHLTLRSLQKQLETANRELEEQNRELERRNADLQEALDTIQTLSGLIPICAWCGRRIEDEAGQWISVEAYIEAHSEAKFTHGMCPKCFEGMKTDADQVLRSR